MPGLKRGNGGMRPTALAAIVLAALLAGRAGLAAEPPAPDYQALLAAPDRSDADRQTDKRRDPAQLLAFIGVRPGEHVLDMAAGAGYSTELMARAVGPTGVVYSQDAPAAMARVKDKFDARAKAPEMKNVIRDIRPYDDPVPPGVHDLDLVTFFYAYHDTTYMKVDRAAMDHKLFDALKPGGLLVLADYSAKPGAGISQTHTLHRIDEAVVKQEFAAAGFKLVAEGNFLKNPNDPRDEPIFHPKIPVDQFVLKFQKPAS